MQKDIFQEKEDEQNLPEPEAYKGIFKFHKYWGKKPVELYSFIISNFSDEGDLVADPFMGSGVMGVPAINQGRVFAGSDINPLSVRLGKFSLTTPSKEELTEGYMKIKDDVKKRINSSYRLKDGRTATHYIWKNGDMELLWKSKRGKKRKEYLPTDHDIKLSKKYDGYDPGDMSMSTFSNSTINAKESLDLDDIFTSRAVRNIHILRESIKSLPDKISRAFELCLTAASGQASSMVFVIDRSGKEGNISVQDISVGSWAIGYWKPERHFEINVWRCFETKYKKLKKGVRDVNSLPEEEITSDLSKIYKKDNSAAISMVDAKHISSKLPSESVSLMVADPPHGDRVPYLELSEMWNTILGQDANYNREIVISDSKERDKSREQYVEDMDHFCKNSTDVLKEGGYLAFIFNSKEDKEWGYIKHLSDSKKMSYIGHFPAEYSVGSLVQDNRSGSMDHDYVLIFQKSTTTNTGNSASPDEWQFLKAGFPF